MHQAAREAPVVIELAVRSNGRYHERPHCVEALAAIGWQALRDGDDRIASVLTSSSTSLPWSARALLGEMKETHCRSLTA